MSDIEHAQAMLRMAQRDLRALRGMQNAEVFADEIFGFHVHDTFMLPYGTSAIARIFHF